MTFRQRGFTLVEVLLTSALAAILCIAVLGVVTSLSRDLRRAQTSDQAEGLWRQRLVQSLASDLSSARQVQWSGSVSGEGSAPGRSPGTLSGSLPGAGVPGSLPGVVIRGYEALGAGDLTPSARPVQITYRLVQAGGESLLLRDQRLLDEPAGGSERSSQLLACGVKSLEIQPLVSPKQSGRPARSGDGAAGLGATDRANRQADLPSKVKVRVTWMNPELPPVERVVILK
jgi:prepilin-type N-terminal cleavage/methylation domain-containing protein